jgi:hypothetical protein
MKTKQKTPNPSATAGSGSGSGFSDTTAANAGANPYAQGLPLGGFAQFPQGMDFLKQFWAQSASAAMHSAPSTPPATPPSPANTATQTSNDPFIMNAMSGMNPAFMQAMAQTMMPTWDVAEIEKRLNDLRTVLQFMDMNTQILRQSLSALEAQRNTISTMQNMMRGQGGFGTNTTPTAL